MSDRIRLIQGDCLEVMKGMADASVDAVVTDPPAGIGFMGKEFDRDRGGRVQWVAWLCECLAEARRVSKPGSYLLCWALPRTSHWTGTAIEDAGWVIRDRVSHLFGTGFPKSKACLKPAMEDWWLAWNPAKYVTPLNIDACRIPAPEGLTSGGQCTPKQRNTYTQDEWTMNWDKPRSLEQPAGRWPSNCTHDGSPEVMEAFAAFGERVSGSRADGVRKGMGWYANSNEPRPDYLNGDGGPAIESSSGSAARFFYCAKASKSDRGDGNTHPTVKNTELMRWLCRLITPPGGTILDPFAGSGSTLIAAEAEGFDGIGIEQSAEYHKIASDRIAAAENAMPLLGSCPRP